MLLNLIHVDILINKNLLNIAFLFLNSNKLLY